VIGLALPSETGLEFELHRRALAREARGLQGERIRLQGQPLTRAARLIPRADTEDCSRTDWKNAVKCEHGAARAQSGTVLQLSDLPKSTEFPPYSSRVFEIYRTRSPRRVVWVPAARRRFSTPALTGAALPLLFVRNASPEDFRELRREATFRSAVQ
jgi:hypothetical protein